MTTSQREWQPIPGTRLRDAVNIPLIFETGSNHGKPSIPSQRTHFFNPDELVGKTFLYERDVDGAIHRGKSLKEFKMQKPLLINI